MPSSDCWSRSAGRTWCDRLVLIGQYYNSDGKTPVATSTADFFDIDSDAHTLSASGV